MITNSPALKAKTFTVTFDNTTFNIVIDSTFSTLIRKFTATEQIEAIHYHTNYELFFVMNDGLDIVTENGKTEYKNIFVVVPPYLKHYSTTHGKNYRLFVSVAHAKNKKSDLYEQITEKIGHSDIIATKITEQLLFYITELDMSLKHKSHELKTQTLLTMIVIEVLEVLGVNSNDDTVFSSEKSNYMLTIENIINKEYKTDVSLEYISSVLGLSTKQTSRIIKKEFNSSLPTLINNKKLSIASLLLKSTNMSVQEIANEVNIENVSYFFSLFKKRYGCTPLQYRNKQ